MDSLASSISPKPSTSSMVNILGVHVTPTNTPDALNKIELAVAQKQKGYVCVTGVHGIMESQEDSKLKDILNAAYLNVPDGMPTVWLGRFHGFHEMRRVYGPDFMLEVCGKLREKNVRHFFYGGNTGVAEKLKLNLTEKFPGLNVVGTYTPPFRPLNREEENQLIQQVKELRPDILWVGLSTPKQERFMSEYLQKLDVSVMLGVGAAFDVHTGNIKDAPKWMQNSGLQWFHRLLQEPKRLWRRYLINNPKFLFKVFLQLSGLKKY